MNDCFEPIVANIPSFIRPITTYIYVRFVSGFSIKVKS